MKGSTRERALSRPEAILEATLAIVGERGLEAVTHRSVSQRAGVSLGAISHHFPSRDSLLEATLRYGADREVSRLERLALDLQARAFDTEEWIDAMSTALARALRSAPAHPLAQYEVLLASARDPRLRDLARAWRTAHLRVAEAGLRGAGSPAPERHAHILAAAITGLALSQLAAPRPNWERDVLRPALQELVAALT
jgi:TetR/AcrR family transcriptional regulator, regulator of biofilm formation and stress response